MRWDEMGWDEVRAQLPNVTQVWWRLGWEAMQLPQETVVSARARACVQARPHVARRQLFRWALTASVR
jgi:hypothetical protein